MKNLNRQITCREFLKEVTQAGATVVVSVGVASAAAPLIAQAGYASCDAEAVTGWSTAIPSTFG